MDITPEIQAVIDAAVDSAKAGLQAKNQELLDKNKKLMKGQEIDPQTVIDLEAQIDKLQSDLSTAHKSGKESVKTLETLQAQLKAETGFTQKLLIDNGLTDELVKNGVAPQFLAATKAMFAGQAQVIADGDTRVAKIGDKSVSDFVKDWAASEDGKHFVSAPANGGGGSQGGKGGGTDAKIINREAFNAKSHAERSEFAKSGGSVID
jgi:hypothetical protein